MLRDEFSGGGNGRDVLAYISHMEMILGAIRRAQAAEVKWQRWRSDAMQSAQQYSELAKGERDNASWWWHQAQVHERLGVPQ